MILQRNCYFCTRNSFPVLRNSVVFCHNGLNGVVAVRWWIRFLWRHLMLCKLCFIAAYGCCSLKLYFMFTLCVSSTHASC